MKRQCTTAEAIRDGHSYTVEPQSPNHLFWWFKHHESCCAETPVEAIGALAFIYRPAHLRGELPLGMTFSVRRVILIDNFGTRHTVPMPDLVIGVKEKVLILRLANKFHRRWMTSQRQRKRGTVKFTVIERPF